jgi:hypothetical protein
MLRSCFGMGGLAGFWTGGGEGMGVGIGGRGEKYRISTAELAEEHTSIGCSDAEGFVQKGG